MKKRSKGSTFVERYALILFGAVFSLFGLLPLVHAIKVILQEGLSKDAVTGLFMSSLFFFVGGAIVSLGWYVFRQLVCDDRERENWPDQPWNRRQDWRDRRVLPDAWPGTCAFIGFAAIWNYFAWGLLFVGMLRGDMESRVIFVVGCFGLIGIIMSLQAIRLVIESRKASRCRLELGLCPIGIGEPFVGKLNVPERLDEDNWVTLTLSCSAPKAYSRSMNAGQSSKVTSIQSEERIVRSYLPEAEWDETVIPVYFDIPPDGSGSSDEESISWRLSAKIAKGLLPYRVQFEIPVFRLQDREVGEVARQTALTYSKHLSEPTFGELVGRRRGTVISDTPSRVDLQFGGAKPLDVLITAAGGGLIVAMIWVMFGDTARWLLMIGILIVCGATLEALATTRIIADETHLHRRRAVFGIGKTRKFAWPDIELIEATLEAEPGEQRTSMCVRLKTRNNEWQTVLDRNPEHVISAAVAQRLNEHRSQYCDA